MVAVRIPTVALVGNPNTGKTTLFNALAGMNQRVGNYPGVTVETKKGKLRHGDLSVDLIDLPGTYSLAPRSPDEMLAVDVILGNNAEEPRPDVVVAIVDASNLERNLYLATQLFELGVPVIIALNMIDIADQQGYRIDIDKLSQQLGLPIVPIQANKGKGLDALKHAVACSLEAGRCPEGPSFPNAFEAEVRRLKSDTSPEEPEFLLRRLLLDVGGYTEMRLLARYGSVLAEDLASARHRLVEAGFKLAGIEARIRYAWIRQRIADCIERPAQRRVLWTDQLDKFLTHKIWGTLIFLLVMFLVFEAIFVAAQPFMEWIKDGVRWLGNWVNDVLSPGPFRSLLVDGVIKGVGAVVVFIPQIMFLFAIIAALEDCGYMARAAFLMDRLMARAGLNGKSFIPLLSSFACAVPGIMAARVIENSRDRLATILVAPLMSCSARYPVYSLLIGAFMPMDEYGWWAPGLVLLGLYLIGIILAPAVALLLKSTLLRGETPVFVMEMPLYKVPSLHTVLRRSFDSGWMFLKRAGTLILATMILVWAALYFPTGTYEQQIAGIEEPLLEPRERLKTLKEELKKIEDESGTENQVFAAKKTELEAARDVLDPQEKKINDLRAQWKEQSILGRVGLSIEPVFAPLGWNWRIGMAAIASFPAREVMVGTLGIIFGEGEGEADDEGYRDALGAAMRGSRVTLPVALSVMVFFALCCQCVSTLVIIKRESNSWRWPIFTFVYMTALAYLGALLTYQVGSLILS